MYVGEGEAMLRGTFKLARAAAPSIIFLDEVDSLAGKRTEGIDSGGGSSSEMRLLSALLTEMDGMELATGVQVLAATNRPDALDDALLRPGRFDVILYVPPPDAHGRLQALKIHSRKIPLANDVNLEDWAAATDFFTGAEIAALCREAAMAALREDLQNAHLVAARHFAAARLAMRPAMTKDSLAQYAAWGDKRSALQ
jgi:SpoVK/Ycf46/Vps4 family AAA+-type ATPase